MKRNLMNKGKITFSNYAHQTARLQVLSSIDTAHLFPGLQIAQSMKILQADQVTCLTWD